MVSDPNKTTAAASSEQVELTDGDVTCTTGITPPTPGQPQQSSSSTSNKVVETYFDPGPMPKNIYNRGFVENWGEVFFPRSLRKDAIERYKQSLLANRQADDIDGKLKRS